MGCGRRPPRAHMVPATAPLPALPYSTTALPSPPTTNPKQEPGPEDAARFPYVEAVMSEALRLYPPAHVTTRECTAPEGCTLVGGDGRQYYIPPRTWWAGWVGRWVAAWTRGWLVAGRWVGR